MKQAELTPYIYPSIKTMKAYIKALKKDDRRLNEVNDFVVYRQRENTVHIVKGFLVDVVHFVDETGGELVGIL